MALTSALKSIVTSCPQYVSYIGTCGKRAGDPLTPEVFYHILDILIVINNALHFERLINNIDILGAPHYHPNHAALRRRARAHDTKNPTTGLFAF